jgi:hypothetical protein
LSAATKLRKLNNLCELYFPPILLRSADDIQILLGKKPSNIRHVPQVEIIFFSMNEPEFLCNSWHELDSKGAIIAGENLSSPQE